jgi:hypothetical protein
MRLISMSLATIPFLAGTKTVTRRVGWLFAVPRMRLRVVQKAQGLAKGEHMTTLGYIELVNVRREPLELMLLYLGYGTGECKREGFSHLNPQQFVDMFCETHKIDPSTYVTRMQYRKIAIDDGKGDRNARIPVDQPPAAAGCICVECS